MRLVPFLSVLATCSLAYVAAASWSRRHRAVRRLYWDGSDRSVVAVDRSAQPQPWLARWLSVAGYRRPTAPLVFGMATAVSAGVGVVAGQIYRVTAMGPL